MSTQYAPIPDPTPAQLLSHRLLGRAQQLEVNAHIARHYLEDGQAFSAPAIADACNLTRQQGYVALAKLRDCGYVLPVYSDSKFKLHTAVPSLLWDWSLGTLEEAMTRLKIRP